MELPKRSRTFLQNRVCTHPGCTTRLSVYNPRKTCYTHTFPWMTYSTPLR